MHLIFDGREFKVVRIGAPRGYWQQEGTIMFSRRASVISISILAVLVMVLFGTASSQVPRKVNYQMRITDSVTGEPEPGPHELVFRVFEEEEGGSALWNETHNVAADTTGVVAVILGSNDPFDIVFDGSMWLEVVVDDETLDPRREIVSVPYAFRALESDHAGDADSLGGTHSGDYIVAGDVGVVTSDMIADGSGSGLDADMLDGLNGDAYADSGHDHDDRYYTQDELDIAGSINDAGNPVDWTKLKNVPAGFTDGTDDVGGAGDGHSLDAADGSPVDAVYVDNDGDVGIGTTMPSAQVEVLGSTNLDAQFRSVRSSGATATFGAEVDAGVLGTNSAHPLVFRTDGGSEQMRIDTEGKVGIGTTSPDRLLHVYDGSAGTVTAQAEAEVVIEDNSHTFLGFLSPNTASQGIHFGDADDSAEGWVLYDHANDKLAFGTVDHDRMTIDGSGRVGIGTAAPTTDLEVEATSWTDIITLGLDTEANRLSLQSGSNWASLRGGTSYRNDIVIEHATGFVGINETYPDKNLDVSGTARFTGDTTAFHTSFTNTNSSGTALVAGGNGISGYYLSGGSGLSGTAAKYGIYARADATGNQGQCAVYTYLLQGTKVVRVNYQSSLGTHYKIQGDGLVSTVMGTKAGKKTLVCPESPEAWIEDYGSGTIASGVCHVDLDPLFLDCVTVDKEQPLKVLVTLTSPITNQFYVKKGLTGFDLVVVGEGAEAGEGTFDYKVVGKWKDNESIRFADYEEPPAAVRAIEPEKQALGLEANM